MSVNYRVLQQGICSSLLQRQLIVSFYCRHHSPKGTVSILIFPNFFNSATFRSLKMDFCVWANTCFDDTTMQECSVMRLWGKWLVNVSFYPSELFLLFYQTTWFQHLQMFGVVVGTRSVFSSARLWWLKLSSDNTVGVRVLPAHVNRTCWRKENSQTGTHQTKLKSSHCVRLLHTAGRQSQSTWGGWSHKFPESSRLPCLLLLICRSYVGHLPQYEFWERLTWWHLQGTHEHKKEISRRGMASQFVLDMPQSPEAAFVLSKETWLLFFKANTRISWRSTQKLWNILP